MAMIVLATLMLLPAIGAAPDTSSSVRFSEDGAAAFLDLWTDDVRVRSPFVGNHDGGTLRLSLNCRPAELRRAWVSHALVKPRSSLDFDFREALAHADLVMHDKVVTVAFRRSGRVRQGRAPLRQSASARGYGIRYTLRLPQALVSPRLLAAWLSETVELQASGRVYGLVARFGPLSDSALEDIERLAVWCGD